MTGPRAVITAQLAYGLGHGSRRVEVPPESVHILRERVIDGWAVVYLEFEDSEGHPWDGVAGARYDHAQERWRQTGAAYGGRASTAGRVSPVCRVELQGFTRNVDDRCCMSGRVYDPTVQRVTVLDEQGRRATDQVGDGVALLVSEAAFGEPKTIELYDANGHLLESRPYDENN